MTADSLFSLLWGSGLLKVPVQLGVQPTVGDQLLMVAIFGHMPTIEHQHPISLLHCR